MRKIVSNQGPGGVLNASLKEELVARKQEIIEFLRTAQEESPAATRILTYPRGGPLPLSYSQERLWFLDQLEPGNASYNMPGAIRLKGKLDLVCLQQTLDEILARHEILRANFETRNDQPVQILAAIQPLPLKIIDLSGLSVEVQTTEARRLTEEEAKRPFDLSKDLLVRTTLLKLSANDHIFLLTIHHIVSDGTSIRIFANEFTKLYTAFVNGQPDPLPPLPVQYADFAQWQREWLEGERLQQQLNYWKHQLSGELPQLELLLDKPRPIIPSHQSGQVHLEVSAPLAASLRSLSQQEDATLFMILLAAFKLLLQRYTGLEDIIVGSPIAGRNQAEVENLIGFFINTLVLRTDLSGNPSFRELLQRVKRTALDAYTHQDIPFEKLLIELHPERNLSRTPIFQVFFNMLNLESEGQQLPGLTAEVIQNSEIGAKFDLTLYLSERNKTIHLNLVYNADLFHAERMKELLAQYEFLLEQVVGNPDQNIASYSLLTDQAKNILPNPSQELHSSWQNAVSETFSQQAQRLPEKIALSDAHGSWTYQQLDATSQSTRQLSAGSMASIPRMW